MHGHDHGDEGSIQESLEKSAKVTRVMFNAPPAFLAYGFVVLASALAGLLIEPGPNGVAKGFLVIGVPALLAGPISAPLAEALGGTLYYKRAASLAAACAGVIAATLLLATPFRALLGVRVSIVLVLAYMMITSVRHAVLYATSDNRHLRTLPVSLLQTAIGLPFVGVLFNFGREELLLTFLLPFAFVLPIVFFLHVFDTPLARNFNVSASELFRYYLDHITSGRMDGEKIIGRFAEPIRAKFGVIAFRRLAGAAEGKKRVKAAIVVPALHPGPIGRLGGSDLPGKIAEAVDNAELVMVPHGPATHDYNPVSTSEVERLGRTVREMVENLEFVPGGSRAVTAGQGVRVTAQAFGDTALLTYTSWPEPIDDVDYGVGHAAELSAQLAGAKQGMFVDCHNSLTPGAGAVFLCTPRADTIIQRAHEATRDALAERVDALRVGIAQNRETFTKAQGVGDQGVQVVVVEAARQTTAYILWDANNALPGVTGLIQKELQGLVDEFQVMTTDNHSVNAIAGSYGPLGHAAAPADVARLTRETVEKALADLEPVESGAMRGVLENFRVYGNQKTVQLTSSINVMTSIFLELVIACMIVQGLAAALIFYLVGVL